MEEDKGIIRVPFMVAGLVLFSCGIIFTHIYMFIGGMFLIIYTAVARFPDD